MGRKTQLLIISRSGMYIFDNQLFVSSCRNVIIKEVNVKVKYFIACLHMITGTYMLTILPNVKNVLYFISFCVPHSWVDAFLYFGRNGFSCNYGHFSLWKVSAEELVFDESFKEDGWDRCAVFHSTVMVK